MTSTKRIPLGTVSAIVFSAILLAGCQTTGSSKSVTLEAIKFVCLSRQDTPRTIGQVAENNAALLALGARKPKCK